MAGSNGMTLSSGSRVTTQKPYDEEITAATGTSKAPGWKHAIIDQNSRRLNVHKEWP